MLGKISQEELESLAIDDFWDKCQDGRDCDETLSIKLISFFDEYVKKSENIIQFIANIFNREPREKKLWYMIYVLFQHCITEEHLQSQDDVDILNNEMTRYHVTIYNFNEPTFSVSDIIK